MISSQKLWPLDHETGLSATICIKEIKMSKLKPPYESRSSNNDHILRLAYVSQIPQWNPGIYAKM
jgi:hypothetical protein